MATKYLHEIVDEVNKLKTKKEKKEYLSQHKNRTALREILRISYHPDIVPLLPETDPPYKENELDEGMVPPVDRELRRFRIFLKGGGYDNIKQSKRESVFIEILQSIHAKEARIVLDAVHKEFKLKNLNRKDLEEVFNADFGLESSKNKGSKDNND